MVITAYHVSATSNLTSIRANPCDSELRDGFLLNLNAASFTTTAYNGRLPTISPYPRSAGEGTYGYRYTTTFNPEDYFKFRMANTRGQAHYLLLRRDDPSETILANFIRACAPQFENLDWDINFPDGERNEYSSDNTFVNVFFVHEVPVNYAGRVEKRGEVFNLLPVTDSSVWYARMVQEAAVSQRMAQVGQCLARVMLNEVGNGRTAQVGVWVETVLNGAGNPVDLVANHQHDQRAEDDDDGVNDITARIGDL